MARKEALQIYLDPEDIEALRRLQDHLSSTVPVSRAAALREAMRRGIATFKLDPTGTT